MAKDKDGLAADERRLIISRKGAKALHKENDPQIMQTRLPLRGTSGQVTRINGRSG